MVKARVVIPLGETEEISGVQIEIVTPHGVFRIGTDNNGETILTTKDGLMILRPHAANGCNISEQPF